MHLHELRSPKGARKRKRIVGRGKGSGAGKTAGRGENGQRSRSGRWVVGPHEGGQMRLIRRLPKMGFRSHRPILYQIVNLESLNKFEDNTEVNAETLKAKGLISSLQKPFKILGDGGIKKALKLKVQAISKPAQLKIEKAGGSVEIVKKLEIQSEKESDPKNK
ncbi:MAG: 50S ribosomal protein L15 [Candidatus Omnitrophica bacterium]|nr:50S ribosomal protein L15 [Candidatus Omnitrophota bacterium]